jgi:hypothetical protein
MNVEQQPFHRTARGSVPDGPAFWAVCGKALGVRVLAVRPAFRGRKYPAGAVTWVNPNLKFENSEFKDGIRFDS